MKRRTWLRFIAAATVGALWASTRSSAQSRPQRVAIEAMKFQLFPSVVTVVRDEPVTLVLSTRDFPHGFALPDFGVRRDLIPGKSLELTFTPHKAGKFHMLCDNFCGEGHDVMSGWLIVHPAS